MNEECLIDVDALPKAPDTWHLPEVQRYLRWKFESERAQLFFALRTRVLTNAEELRAMELGESLNIQNGVSYFPDQKARELNDAWFAQRRLQLLAKVANS